MLQHKLESIKSAINPSDLQTALKSLYTLELILIILSIYSLYIYREEFTLVDLDNLLIFSIGLITFVAIFFSLLTQRDLFEKLENFWSEIDIYGKNLRRKFDEEKKKAEEIGMSEEYVLRNRPKLDFIAKAKAMLRLELFLYISVFFLILSQFYIVFNISSFVIFIFLLISLLAIFHILTVWLFLTSDEIRRLMSK